MSFLAIARTPASFAPGNRGQSPILVNRGKGEKSSMGGLGVGEDAQLEIGL
jgi:hypothetical protein